MNYIYQITNLTNNKIYIGVHKTDNINDGYMGSGKIITQAIKKYGINNFKKEILEYFDTYELALAKEQNIVTDEFLLRNDVYNLRRGGTGGFDYINKNGLSGAIEHGIIGGAATKARFNDPEFAAYRSKMSSDDITTSHRAGKLDHTHFGTAAWSKRAVEKSKSPESKEKRKNTFADIKHQQGDKNNQYGTCWITNGTENKKVKNTDTILEGWYKGRVQSSKKL